MIQRLRSAIHHLPRWHIVGAVTLAMIVSLCVYLNYANALTTTLVPNQTENNAWTAGTAGCTTATTGHECVDEGTTANTTDFVATGTSLGDGVSTTFHIADQPNVGNATNVTVYYYARSVTLNGNTPNADTVTMNLSIGGGPVGTGSVQSMSTTWSWYSAQYTGNWTQQQIDDMKTTFTRTVVGGGNQANADDNVQISSVYVSMVYTSPVNISQVAYRWFGAEKTRPSGVYSTATTYGTGTNPQGIVVDDFNNDQTIDIVTANVETDNISVLIGSGDGTFAAKIDYAGGDGPKKIISTDLNNDQDKDLVVVNVNNASISVFLGNSDGTFAAKVDYAAQTANDDIAAGDINNDGFVDIVTTGSVLNTYSLFTGNGDGTLDAAVNASGNGFRGLAITDVNNDQNRDLLFANLGTNSVSVLLGNGDGTFATKVDYAAESSSSSIAVTDFNNDQKKDIVIGSLATTNVSVLFGNGDGTFGSRVAYPAQNAVTSLVAADVNGDQYKDIVTFADTGSTGVRVLLNKEDGTFGASSYYSASGFAAFGAVADINKDGAPDAVAVTKNTNAVSVLLNGFNYPALNTINTAAKVPANSNNFRLRINLGVTGATLSTGSSFKLRYQTKSGSCSTSPAAYADVTATSVIRYYDDPALVNRSAYVRIDKDPTRAGVLPTYQTYDESNNFSSTSAVFEGRDGLWDLSLAADPSAVPGSTYCLLVTKSDNTALNSYTVIPEITIPNSTQEQSNYRFYQNANSATPGNPLAAQNAKPNVPVGSSFRLRQLLRQTNETSDVGASFKLQAAERITSCSAGSYATLSTVASSGLTTSTGFKSPGYVDNAGGVGGAGGYWTNVTEGAMEDGIGTYYTISSSNINTTEPLIAASYGFNLPEQSTISGVEMKYKTVFAYYVGEYGIYLTKDKSSGVGDNMASGLAITQGETIIKGSPSNMWGIMLSPSEVNSTDFGVRFAASLDFSNAPPDIEIDYLSMNIHYVTGATLASFTNNAAPADNAAITTTGGDPTASSGSIVPQSYSEDETAIVRTALQTGENGLWDFSLRADESLIGKTYCFRMAKNDGTALASYAQYPEVTFTAAGPTLSQQMRGGQSVRDGLKSSLNW